MRTAGAGLFSVLHLFRPLSKRSEHQEPAQFNLSETYQLVDNPHTAALFQMRAIMPYYEWILALVRKWIGLRVIEAGCGIGNFTQLLAHIADYVLAVDISETNLFLARNRLLKIDNVDFAQMDLEIECPLASNTDIDTVVCMDVLEHIVDDVDLVRKFYDVVRCGGRLIVKVPSCPGLFSSIDRASGHHRRYSKATILETLTSVGWKPIFIKHMNLVGLFPYFVKGRVLKRPTNFSRTFTAGQLDLIRRSIPIARMIDHVFGPPIGLSLIVVAERTD